ILGHRTNHWKIDAGRTGVRMALLCWVESASTLLSEIVMNERKIRWGILSTAKIGVEKVIPALAKSQYCEVVALGSRRLDAARDAADSLGIPHAWGSYEELIADPDVDAVYNPLPNHLHVP